MPKYDVEASFWRDWARLSPAEQDQFLETIRKLVHDLKQGKGVQRRKEVWELTWADDGRATFQLGASAEAGDVHVIWCRIGGHDILNDP